MLLPHSSRGSALAAEMAGWRSDFLKQMGCSSWLGFVAVEELHSLG